jgi:hypothetical protein
MIKRVNSILIGFAFLASFVFFGFQPAKPAKAQPIDYTLTTSEIVNSTIENIQNFGSSKTVDISIVEYSVRYGLIDGEIQEFTKLATNGFGSNETYGLSNYTSAHLRADFVRVSKNYHLIFTFEIKQDAKIVITNPQCKLNNDSRKLIVTAYQTDGENTVAIENKQVPEANSTTTILQNELGAELHAKAGDTVFYVVGSVNYDGLSFDQGNPILVFDFLGSQYSEAERYDFEALKLYKDEVAQMCQRIQQYYDNLNKDDYSFDNQLELIDILEVALNQAQELTLGDSLEEYETSIIQRFENVLTLQQQDQILQDKKAEALEELNNHFADYSRWDYSSKNWNKMRQIIQKAKDDIQNANSIALVNIALSNAKAALRDVQTGGNLFWLWITLGCVGVIAAAVITTFILIKRKK